MGTDNTNTEVISYKPVHLLDNLQSLLEKQIEMARRSDFRGVEVLAERTNSIVAEIGRTKVFEQVGLDDRCKFLARLYKKLALMVAAKKHLLGKQLQQVSEGRRTLQAYRKSV